MSGWIAFAFVMSTTQTPLSEALDATDAPDTLRAAFTLSVRSGDAVRTVRYDPRLAPGEVWTLSDPRGRSDELDIVLSEWRAVDSADAMIFPDDLRLRLGADVEVEDMGAAWALSFRPSLTVRDTVLDIRASEHLAGLVWVEPETERVVRIEYASTRPFDVRGLGRVDSLTQSYVLSYDERLGISFISAFDIAYSGSRGPISRSSRIEARLVDVEFFFSSPAAEVEWMKIREDKSGRLASRR